MNRAVAWTSALLVFVALAVSGCGLRLTRDSPHFTVAPPAPPGLATVYIFRPRLSEVASAVFPVTFFNGVKVAGVEDNSYTYVYVAPGNYSITTKKSQMLTMLDNVPGEFTVTDTGAYYVAFITSGRTSVVSLGKSMATIAGPTTHSWRILSEREAMQYLPSLRYLEPYAQQLP